MKMLSGLIDISPAISPELAVWPGDVSFSREIALNMKSGDNLTLSSIRSTVHLGAHTDAPNHYVKDGEDIASRNLDLYFGLCQVIFVEVERGTRIARGDFKEVIKAERVLVGTGTYPNPHQFNADFASFSPEAIAYLSDCGVRLIGIDTPSIDLCDDKELLSHSAVAQRDMGVLEGIVLEGVAPGLYQLIALPLKIVGADASPVRAVLCPL